MIYIRGVYEIYKDVGPLAIASRGPYYFSLIVAGKFDVKFNVAVTRLIPGICT